MAGKSWTEKAAEHVAIVQFGACAKNGQKLDFLGNNFLTTFSDFFFLASFLPFRWPFYSQYLLHHYILYYFWLPYKAGCSLWAEPRNGTLINYRSSEQYYHYFCTKICNVFFLIRYFKMQSISRNYHCVDKAILALPSAYKEYLVTLKLVTWLVLQRARSLGTYQVHPWEVKLSVIAGMDTPKYG